MSLRSIIDKVKPNFEKGGKFEKLHSTFEAFESFAYTPNRVTTKGSHVRDAVDVKRTIILVVIALIPATLFGMWNIGHQTALAYGSAVSFAPTDVWQCFWFGFLRMLPIIVVSYAVGLLIEFIFAEVRHEQVSEGYIATGLIISLIVPVTIPLWQLALAVAFAVVIGKEVFGGSGMNFLNPALVARAFLFFSYPTRMSGDNVWVAKPFGYEGAGYAVDSFSGATPLGEMMAGVQVHASVMDMFVGNIPGSIGETSVIAILIGALILLFTGVASWRIMLSVVIGGGLMGLLFNAIGANDYMNVPWWHHYLIGGFAFGTVFMATDPVTSAQTNCGKWIYGLLIGAFAVLLRVLNPAYPEGMMLAILLMNCFAPLIDHYVVQANIKKRKKRALAA